MPRACLFFAGRDDGKIPAELSARSLLEAWRAIAPGALHGELAVIEPGLGDELATMCRQNGIAWRNELISEVDPSAFDVILVGAIPTLKKGGDTANARVHDAFPELLEETKKMLGKRMARPGETFAVSVEHNNMKKMVILMVGPSLNPKRANFVSQEDACQARLVSMYSSALRQASDWISRSVKDDIEEEESFEETARKKAKVIDSSDERSSVGLNVIGLGTLPFGVTYPDPRVRPSPKALEEIFTAWIQTRLQNHPRERCLIDLADTYCSGPNDFHYVESVLGKVLNTLKLNHSKDRLALATKCGMSRISSESSGWRVKFNLTPEYIRQRTNESVAALQTDSIFLWQLHHADHLFKKSRDSFNAILEEAVKMRSEGLIEEFGLCNVNVEMMKAAIPKGLFSIQNEYSYWARDPERKGIFDLCRKSNILFVGHSPFGGLKARRKERDILRALPSLASIAGRIGAASPHQVYLRYLVHRGERLGVTMVIIPGGRTLEHVSDSANASTITLTSADIAQLDHEWDTRK